MNGAAVLTPNILANNGIVHAIDMVLLNDSDAAVPTPVAAPNKAPQPAPTPQA